MDQAAKNSSPSKLGGDRIKAQVPLESTEDTNDDREPRQCGPTRDVRLRNELRRNYHSGQPPENRGREGELPDLAPKRGKRKGWDRPPNIPPTPPLKSHR